MEYHNPRETRRNGKTAHIYPRVQFKLNLDMLRGEKKVAQICRERDITPRIVAVQVGRDAFFERAPSIFADQRDSSAPSHHGAYGGDGTLGGATDAGNRSAKKARNLLNSRSQPNGRSLSN